MLRTTPYHNAVTYFLQKNLGVLQWGKNVSLVQNLFQTLNVAVIIRTGSIFYGEFSKPSVVDKIRKRSFSKGKILTNIF